MSNLTNATGVQLALQREVDRLGSQAAVAHELRASKVSISLMLTHGIMHKTLVRKLGVEVVTLYRKVKQ